MRGAGCVAGRREDVGANPGGDSAVGGSTARLEEAEGGAAFLALGDSSDACRAFGGGCLAVAAWWGLHRETGKEPLVVAEAPRHEVMLRLANGETVQVRSLQDSVGLREGSARIWVDTSSFMAYRPMQEMQPDTLVYNVLSVPRSCEYRLRLADGTMVWLNSDSELRYPVNFAGRERRVFLKGEAYFDVAKCEGKKFIVHSGAAQVTVLGTEFNVKNYEDGAMAATLVEGSVLVDHAGQQCALVPGQQAMVDKEGIEVKEVETILYTAWKDGYFIYREASLDDIMQELSRWYDFTYFYQNSRVADLSLTAKLRKFDHVEDVFGILKMTGQVDFVVKGKTVTVMAK